MWLRQALSVILLPGTVAVAIPVWLARRNGLELRSPHSFAEVAAVVAGVLALGLGLTLFIGSLRRFASEGKGTLAPWDPPRHLVVHGLYRFVRNPMISGVIFVLAGEALILQSAPHAWWALIFLASNAVYIPLLEEPMLEGRFGEEVPRLSAKRASVPAAVDPLDPGGSTGRRDRSRRSARVDRSRDTAGDTRRSIAGGVRSRSCARSAQCAVLVAAAPR